MKKLLILILLFWNVVHGQVVTPTDSAGVRAAINAWIKTNGTKQITGAQLNAILNSMRNVPVPTPAGYVNSGKLDTARIPTYALSVITPIHVYTPTNSLYVDTATALKDGIIVKGDWSIFNAKAPTASPSFTGQVNINGTGYYNLNLLSTNAVTGVATGAYIKETADAHGRALLGTIDGGGFYEPALWLGTPADAPTLSNYVLEFDGGGAGTVLNSPSTDDVTFRVGNSTKGKIDHTTGAWSFNALSGSGTKMVIVDNNGLQSVTTNLAAGTTADNQTAANNTGLVANTAFVFAERSNTATLTNHRITPRIGTVASSATPTPDGDNNDEFTITALTAAATFAAPTGTPTDGQSLLIRIKDNATARALSWNAIYRASTDFALPTTTVLSKTMYVQFVYNVADTKWDCIGMTNGF